MDNRIGLYRGWGVRRDPQRAARAVFSAERLVLGFESTPSDFGLDTKKQLDQAISQVLDRRTFATLAPHDD